MCYSNRGELIRPEFVAKVTRPIYRLGSAAALVGALACGGAAVTAPLTVAKTAQAEPAKKPAPAQSEKNAKAGEKKDGDTETIKGHSFRITILDGTIAEKKKATEKYKKYTDSQNGAGVPRERNTNGKYTHEIFVRDDANGIKANFFVFFEPGKDNLDIRFPKEKDTTQKGEAAGVRTINLNLLRKMVEEVTGKKMGGVDYLVETGTFEANGKQKPYIDVTIIPLDKPLKDGGKGFEVNGGVLGMGIGYYDDVVGGVAVMLVEGKKPRDDRVAAAK